MDSFELKKEQLKLSPKVELRDNFTKLKTIGGAECAAFGNKLLASLVICSFPELKVLEHKTYLLHDPLPYSFSFTAYREMPALIEAYNQLELEPDVLLVKGEGILHPRRFGLASHLGLALNKATIGVQESLPFGKIEQGKIFFRNELVGFEVITREHANPLYVSPGHLISLGSMLRIVKETIQFPHKMPEPLHLAHKLRKKKMKELLSGEQKAECISGENSKPEIRTELLEKNEAKILENNVEGVKESGN